MFVRPEAMHSDLMSLFDVETASLSSHRVAVYLPSVEDKSLICVEGGEKDGEDYGALHMITTEFMCRELGEVTRFSAETICMDEAGKLHLRQIEIAECFCNGIVLTDAAGKLRQFCGIVALAFGLPYITVVIDGYSVDFRPREIDRSEYAATCGKPKARRSPVVQFVFRKMKFWKTTPAPIA